MKRNNKQGIAIIVAFAAGLFGAAAVHAQSAVTVTPAKGQSAGQMDADKAECTSIAQQSAAPAAAPAAPARGGALRGAARGAAAGAVVADRNGGNAYNRAGENAQQEYRQEQAKQGAKVGAVVGAGQQRRANVQNAQQQQASGQQAIDSAFRSCLMGRGYNVQ